MPEHPQAIIRSTRLDPPRSAAGAGGYGAGGGGPAAPGPRGGREHHPIDRPPAPRRAAPDEVGNGLMVSAGLHTAVVVALLLGLPQLWQTPPPPELPSTKIAFVMNPGETTRTPTPNKHPKPTAKPIDPPPVPSEKPIPDPLVQPPPEKPQPPSPPPPPPPPPPPSPEPPKPEVKPSPPPPPPPVPTPTEKPLPPPEPPKPEVKPPPPKPVAKTEPPKPVKKPVDPLDSDWAGTVAKIAASNPDKPAPQQKKDKPQQSAESSLPDAPSGKLATSEKEALADAVSNCWGWDGGVKDNDQLTAQIKVHIDPDGTPREPTILSVSGGDERTRLAFSGRAVRSFLLPDCAKLPLTAGKYPLGADITFTFSPKEVR